jgi:hypothetical protein
MEKPNYFKLVLRDKTVYFIVSHIKKYNVYSLHGKDFYDYQIIIKNFHQKNNSEPFEEKYSGLLLCVDNKKNICIYDNIKKKYIDIEKTDDLHHVSYYYGENIHYFSLENLVKEILLNIFLSEN